MALASKKKGSASPASDPSRDHSKPSRGKPMNTHTDTTSTATAASFPVLYPSQTSFDDLEDAMSMLRVVNIVLSDTNGCSPHTANDLAVIISTVEDRLGPILVHLRNADMGDRSNRYLDARREFVRNPGSVL